MRIGRIAILVVLSAGCSEPTPPANSPAPPLEAVPFALLGTGKIAFERIAADYHAVYLIDPVTSTSKVVIRGILDGPALSPDGEHLAITAYGGSGRSRDVHVLKTDGTDVHPVSAYTGDEGVAAWTPDGARLTFLRDQDAGPYKMMTEVRASDGAVQRSLALRRADGCSAIYVGDPEDRVEVSATGLIATPCSLNEIVILSSEGVRIGKYSVSSPSLIIGFSWSPDGSKLAVMEMAGSGSGVPISQTLRIMSADGGSPREVFTVPLVLTQNGRYPGANDSSICWLKGVDRLLVTILHEARRYSQLWVVNENGTGLTRITTASGTTDRSATCSR